MWFTSPENLQVVKASIPEVTDLNKIILKDNEIGIPVEFERTSTRTGGKIDLLVRESNFASFDVPEIDLSQQNKQTVILRIQRNAVNPLAYNSVQVSFVGAAGNPLNFKFALEPVARLSLINGGTDTTYTAKSTSAALQVNAEFIQGVIDQPVTIDVSGDLNTAVSIGTGHLTSSADKRFVTIDFVDATSKINAGWSTASNPYLFPFVMSKEENRTLDGVSAFMYRYNQNTKNFIAYDTRYFDSNMLLRPLEGFILQSNSRAATFEMHASARNTNYNRRNTGYFVMSQEQEIELELWLDTVMYDRTALRFNLASSNDFVFDEDAAKIFSTETVTPQIYTVLNGDKFSVNSIYPAVMDIPLGIKTYKGGTFKFRLTKATHDTQTTVHLVDLTTGETVALRETGDIYSVALTSATGVNEKRFVLRISEVSAVDNLQAHGMNVWAERNKCFVSGLTAGSRVSVIDASGRLVADQTADSDTWNTTLSTGVYMLRVIKDGKEFKTKIIIR